MGSEMCIRDRVKSAWKNLPVEEVTVDENRPHFVKTIADPVNQVKGYDLPVSAFTGYEDGTMPNGSAAYEKRGTANFVPMWLPDNCIQCNQCSFVCPHAVVRPFLVSE